MTCTVAAIISFLGYMPPPGTVITIPAAAAQQYSSMKVAYAKRCARRYGIRWQIADETP